MKKEDHWIRQSTQSKWPLRSSVAFFIHSNPLPLLVHRMCVGVTDPIAEATTTWPDETADRCFVFRTNNRDFFLVAETAEEKK